jgi:hypothetical protein
LGAITDQAERALATPPKQQPCGSSANNAAPVLPPLPAGATELNFSEFFVSPVGDRGLMLTEKLRGLDGKRVRILGYIVRQEEIQDAIATHTASYIVLSAAGRGSGLFTGVMDNTDVVFKVTRVALGDNRIRPDTMNLIGNPGRVRSRDEAPADNEVPEE